MKRVAIWDLFGMTKRVRCIWAKRIGEFGVGTNYGISRYCYDLLFDEKIGGTAHIALGRAYSQCGGINQSAFHWDLIKDLREEGELFLDEKVVSNS